MPDNPQTETEAPDFPDVTKEEEQGQATADRIPIEAIQGAAPGREAGAHRVIQEAKTGVAEEGGKMGVSSAPTLDLPAETTASDIIVNRNGQLGGRGDELVESGNDLVEMGTREALGRVAAIGRGDLVRVLEIECNGEARLLLPFSQWTPAERACVKEISRQPRSGALIIKWADRLPALELVGKHLHLWQEESGRSAPSVTIQIGGALGAALAASRQPVTIEAVAVPARLPAAIDKPDNG